MNANICKDIVEYRWVQNHIHIQNWSNFTFSYNMEPHSQHVHNCISCPKTRKWQLVPYTQNEIFCSNYHIMDNVQLMSLSITISTLGTPKKILKSIFLYFSFIQEYYVSLDFEMETKNIYQYFPIVVSVNTLNKQNQSSNLKKLTIDDTTNCEGISLLLQPSLSTMPPCNNYRKQLIKKDQKA